MGSWGWIGRCRRRSVVALQWPLYLGLGDQEGGGRLEPKASLPTTMRKSPQIRQLPALSLPQLEDGKMNGR